MQISFSATGTLWQIDIYDEDPSDQDLLTKQITDFVEDFERNFSRFKDTSIITKLSQKAGTYQLPKDAKPLLDFYDKLHQLTDGLFTPTIGKSLISAGYDKDNTLRPQKSLSKSDNWKNITYDAYNIAAKNPTQLDFGAAGKGYLVDLLTDLLKDRGVNNFCVDAGGDIRVHGKKKLTIGLENPSDTSMVIGTIEIQNNSLCGSSGNRRQWGKYNHLLNPKTLTSPKNILATWVLANEGMVADGLATALFFVEPIKLQSHFDFQYLRLYSDFSVQKSKNLSATLFN